MVVDFIEEIESSQEVKDLFLISVTKREIEVLEKISQGLTVKEIAQQLFVSCHTIISHKKNLMERFNARNMVDLTVKAIRYNIINV